MTGFGDIHWLLGMKLEHDQPARTISISQEVFTNSMPVRVAVLHKPSNNVQAVTTNTGTYGQVVHNSLHGLGLSRHTISTQW